MNTDDQVRFWEGELKKAEERWKDVPAPSYEIHYWRDIVPYRHLVRMVRLKADLPVCWGAADCVKYAYQKCAAGKHETCADHCASCLRCREE